MKIRRISIATLMAIVVILAVDVAAIRSPWPTPTDTAELFFFALGVLPMASLLAFCAVVGMPRLSRGGIISSRLLGFAVFGWASVALWIGLSANATQLISNWADTIGEPFFRLIEPNNESAMKLGAAFYTVILTVPEVTIAVLGRRIMERSGLTVRIERRVS